MDDFKSDIFKQRRVFGIRQNVFFLGVVSFFNDFSHEMVKAVMPVFLTTVLGVTPAFVGFLDGASDAVASVLRMVSGWFSDKLGERKRFAVLGYTLSVCTRWLLAFVATGWQVFTLRVIDRVGKGVREAPRDALLSVSVSDREASRSFGFQRSLDALGGVVGPIFALLLLPVVHDDYRLFFIIASALGLLALAAFSFVRDVRTADGLRPQNEFSSLLSLKHFTPGFKLFILAIFVFGLGYMPIALVVLRAQQFSCCSESVPLLYLVTAIASWLFAIPAGYLAEQIGRRRTILLGFTAATLGYAILAQSDSLGVMSVGAVLLGAYSGFTDGMQRAFASKLLASHHVAAGHGLLQAAIGVSSLIAGTMGGIVWTIYGSTAAFLLGGLLMAAGATIFAAINPYKTNP